MELPVISEAEMALPRLPGDRSNRYGPKDFQGNELRHRTQAVWEECVRCLGAVTKQACGRNHPVSQVNPVQRDQLAVSPVLMILHTGM